MEVLFLVLIFIDIDTLVHSAEEEPPHTINGRNFLHIQEPLSFTDAKDKCLEKGYELAVFRTVEEMNHFKEEQLSGWVGMKCGHNGQYVWSDGRSITHGAWIGTDKCTGDDGVIFDGHGSFNALSSDSTFFVLCSEIRNYESSILLPAIKDIKNLMRVSNSFPEVSSALPVVSKEDEQEEDVNAKLLKNIEEEIKSQSSELSKITKKLSYVETKAKKSFNTLLVTVITSILVLIGVAVIIFSLMKSGQLTANEMSQEDIKRKSGFNP